MQSVLRFAQHTLVGIRCFSAHIIWAIFHPNDKNQQKQHDIDIKEITGDRPSEQWTYYDSCDKIWISQLIISLWMQSYDLESLANLSSQSWKSPHPPKKKGVKIQLVSFLVVPGLEIWEFFFCFTTFPIAYNKSTMNVLFEQLSHAKRTTLTFHEILFV